MYSQEAQEMLSVSEVAFPRRQGLLDISHLSSPKQSRYLPISSANRHTNVREAEGRGSRPQQAHLLQLLYALNEIRPPRAVLLMPVPSSLKNKDRLRLERYVRFWQRRYVAYAPGEFQHRSEGLGRGTAILRDNSTAGVRSWNWQLLGEEEMPRKMLPDVQAMVRA